MKLGTLELVNPVFLAPMAGISDLPYRRLMKSFGASLVFSEMISANGLHYGGSATIELLRSHAEERPLGVQIFGADPELMAAAARKVAPGADLIDINMGCPVKKVTRSGAGSALLREPERVAAILQAVRKATELPLTIKIRSGWDDASRNYLDIARLAVDAGVDAITLHPRTRSEGFGGHSAWREIARLKSCIDIPVIGSGDLFSVADAERMFCETGCDGIMIGRGGYGNPWLIRNILTVRAGREQVTPDTRDRYRVAQRHLELFLESYPAEKAVRDMRKHLSWYTHGLPGSAQFRGELNKTRDFDAFMTLFHDYFQARIGEGP